MKKSLFRPLCVALPALVCALSLPVVSQPLALRQSAAKVTARVATCADADATEAASRLFARAAENYGAATNVKFDYTNVIKLDEDSISSRGTMIFEAPARFRLEQTRMRDKTVFVYNGHSLMMQQNDELPQRVVVRPNYTVWDELPDVSLPDPFIDSFLAGENPLEDLLAETTDVKRVPDQTINGAVCEGVSIVNATEEETLAISAWFSRESGLLIRVIARTGGATITSNYARVELDGDIAPGTFVLKTDDTDVA